MNDKDDPTFGKPVRLNSDNLLRKTDDRSVSPLIVMETPAAKGEVVLVGISPLRRVYPAWRAGQEINRRGGGGPALVPQNKL